MKNRVLTIELPEKIIYENSESFGSELFRIVENSKDFDSITLDLDFTQMVSSAGLRVLLRLSKQYKVKLINVTSSVYEVFQMTGFTSFMEVEKGLRKISLENATLIGEGFFSKVYRIDKDTIVKVFIRDTCYEDVKKELDHAKSAFLLGIPTAISFDIVRVDNHLGVVFELLNAGSLKKYIINNPYKHDYIIKSYTKLLKTINSTYADSDEIPSQYEIFLNKIKFIENDISKEEKEKILDLMSTIEETNTFLHNDCHMKNIMVSNDEFFLIDMETFSKGNPIFELSGITESYVCFSSYDDEAQEGFFGVNSKTLLRIYADVTREYFSNLSFKDYRENLFKIYLLSYTHMLFWIRSYSTDEKFFEFCYKRFKIYLKLVKDLKLKY